MGNSESPDIKIDRDAENLVAQAKAAANRRRILLINPRFQISVMIQGLLLIVFITALFYFYETFFLYQVSQIVIEGRGAQGDLIAKIESLHTRMFPWFILVLVAVSFIIMSFLLFFSHRIAGPIYHVVNYLNAVGENPKNKRLITFREKDYFHELAEAINVALPTDKSPDAKLPKSSTDRD
jgi:hypothetical protein